MPEPKSMRTGVPPGGTRERREGRVGTVRDRRVVGATLDRETSTSDCNELQRCHRLEAVGVEVAGGCRCPQNYKNTRPVQLQVKGQQL